MVALALMSGWSCADAIAAPVNGPCSLTYAHRVDAFYFPDGGVVEAFDATASEAVINCPVIRPTASYRASVHGQDITYLITWP